MEVQLHQLQPIGSDLNRPECVLTHSSGLVFASDWSGNGGVSIIKPDQSIQKILCNYATPLRPNGIALEKEGNFLLAHLGADTGGVFRLKPDGSVEPVLVELNGETLPPTNFVCIDNKGELWITVSTRTCPRADAYRSTVNTGFIIHVSADGPSIVAEDLGYTNECALSPDGSTLFVNETFGRRLSAFDIKPGGKLGPRRTVAHFGVGTYPDGLCLSTDGSLWITSIVSNRIIRVHPGGRIETILEDSDPDHIEWAEQAYLSGTMGRPHLDNSRSKQLKNISCLAFGGDSLQTGYLGCLLGDSLHSVELPVTGIPLSHWNVSLENLLAHIN